MRLESNWNLGWQTAPAKEHTLRLRMSTRTTKVFLSQHPELELATNSAAIRALLFKLFFEGHMPGMIEGIGMPTDTPGGVKWEAETDYEGTNSFERHGDGGPVLQSQGTFLVNVRTDRDVTAGQALGIARGLIASAVANQIVDALKGEMLGTRSTDTRGSSLTKGDRVVDFRSQENGPGPLQN